MKTSTDRILTTHVGSMPRPESIRTLLRAALAGQPIDEAVMAARAAEAVGDVVRRQAEVGLDVVSAGEPFVPAIAPAMVGRGQNRYYKTEEEYVFAIAEALRTEYRAIVDAGFVLQIDDPGLGETWDMLIPAPPVEDYRKMQA